MPYYLFVYSPSDFVSPLPAENAAGNFSGTLPYTLTLRPGATPTRIEVTDNDPYFQEVDAQGLQTLTHAVNLDGTTYAAGTTINSAYDLFSTTSTMRVVTLHFGGDGYFAGPVHGLVSTEPLVPGHAYTFNRTVTSNGINHPYQSLACFVTGTRIATRKGEVAVEALQPGAEVFTIDDGYRPVRQVLTTTVKATGKFAPVVIPAGTLNNERDLRVSPQHRMLISGPQAQLLFGEGEVLVAAQHLVTAGLAYQQPGGEVTYCHLVFDDHQIIFAEGSPTESFLPSAPGVLPEVFQEFDALFPNAARLCLRAHEAALLLGQNQPQAAEMRLAA